jgi:RNA polymerase sigma-70 factor (ECF subfamily)
VTPADHLQLKTWLAAIPRRDASSVTAFRALYDVAAPKLLGFALRILSRRELAEEALQDGFVSIWHNAASYRSELAAPMTWMSTIVRNKAFDILRRMDDTVEMDADVFDRDLMDAMVSPEPTPPDVLQRRGEASELARCLAQLESPHRQAIALAYYHDLSHSEVAQQMKLPIGTVKTWIRRGLERLRRCLGRQESA